MQKIKRPERNPDCYMYKIIDKRILSLLKELAEINDRKIEVFWEMNCNDA